MAVRHPLARVLSAYYDKLKYHLHQSGGYKCAYCKEVGADIVLSHGGTIHNGLEINVTLNDFLGRLTEPDKIGYANPHWTEISDIALPLGHSIHQSLLFSTTSIRYSIVEDEYRVVKQRKQRIINAIYGIHPTSD